MIYERFEIRNFKGIVNLDFDLKNKTGAKIFTLVGLNESGKTTILEAINSFTYNTGNLKPLNIKGYKINDSHAMIPLSKRGNFNENVEITAHVRFEDGDIEKLKQSVKEKNGLTVTKISEAFSITTVNCFKHSIYNSADSNNAWGLTASGKKGQQKRSSDMHGEDWNAVTNATMEFLPEILYFPNFLFDFPEKVLLDRVGEQEKSSFYQLLIQDVLNSIDKNLDIKTHLISRIKSKKPSEKRTLDALLVDMERSMTETIFGAWDNIFSKGKSDKKVRITAFNDEKDGPYLQFQIYENESYYLITERSLGFRWFFVFLLLIHYRRYRKTLGRKTIILLDEPASNLHPAAQKLLLKSFENLPSEIVVIYTTHSHYLINPNWFESSFVIENVAISLGNEIDYSPKQTNIQATPYRQYFALHPDKHSYFKPMLDVLNYAPSFIEYSDKAIIIEGKCDFYTLKYMADIVLGAGNYHLIPGTSASNMMDLISLYVSWNKNYMIILDSDEEGLKSLEKYRDEFGIIVEGNIFTLNLIDPAWVGIAMESLFTKDDRLKVQQKYYPSSLKFNKKVFNHSIQELLIKKEKVQLQEETNSNFRTIFHFIDEKLS